MDQVQVKKQLEIMRTFITNEAEEKVREIRTKTEEEFTIEKSKIVQSGQLKIIQEFDRKKRATEVEKKIAYSNELSKARLQILKAREIGVNNILDTARDRLEHLSKGSKYKDLLVSLILQGLKRLNEPEVEVRARLEDTEIVKHAIPIAVEQYEKLTNKKVIATLDTKRPLPPSPANAGPKAISTCAGGIILCTKGDRIVCNNTLDVRLQYAFEAAVPAVRAKLFTVEVL